MNITNDDENMWLIPFTENEDHWLRIHLPEPQHISGLRFWNYNKSAEDTYRGVCIYICVCVCKCMCTGVYVGSDWMAE